ncbi:MAG TPA: hypothetical protein PK411_07170 [Mesotoga infera]|jgi:hypothetical protein|uniref:Outer membrane protein beta-barrel domain-containing protein n=1 Tax=Mesotoga infera TaxID=1236046 RepID=A0A7Z7LFH1_9BACT|nr:hypothetical protein [Mesotoga infera]MBP8659622.1 hypothetical protein [Mesotoga sp.]NLI06121.1 hypothetical protein [Thermotogaceae bacterium]SSC12986.1 conserved exported protein of unknown function [Mesotoga infera]HNR78681.1 hypothetical protein [Mesotoga infera]HOI34273.1 hypothetical protein [Mesotoga infera]
MKKVALVALLLSAVIMGFSAPKALIGGAFGINATNPIYQPERWGAGALDLSLQLPFTEKIGTTLSAQAAIRYPTNKIGLLNADIYFQIFEVLNLQVRLLVSIGTVQDTIVGQQSWVLCGFDLGAPHLAIGGGFQVMAPITEKVTLNGYARGYRVYKYATRQEGNFPGGDYWPLPEFFSVGLGVLYSF